MELSEIEEGNELIAIWRRIPKCKRCENCNHYKFGSGIYYTPSEMQYHYSWDNWLMPVLEEIYLCGLVKTVHLGFNKTVIILITNEQIISPGLPTNSMANEAFIAVVEFIKWYNSQTSGIWFKNKE